MEQRKDNHQGKCIGFDPARPQGNEVEKKMDNKSWQKCARRQ
jgi:hypothetical protein